MNKLRIGIDVDGILADFNPGYKALVEATTAVRLPEISATFPDTWNYAVDAGVTPEEDKAIWKIISESQSFWYDLDPYPEAIPFLKRLSDFPDSVDTYFITSRPGMVSKKQTEDWLETFGYVGDKFPTVLISSNKGDCASALRLTHYIDDRNENCWDVRDVSPTTKNFMLARPWNKVLEGVPRITDLNSFQLVLEADLNG